MRATAFVYASRPSGKRIALRFTSAIAASSIIFISAASFVLEIDSIRRTSHYDSLIVERMTAEIGRHEIGNIETIYFFGLRWVYADAPKINPRIASHIRVDWAINGHFGAVAAQTARPWVVPIMNGDIVDLQTHQQLMLGLDENLNVRKLTYYNGLLFFADTNEIFGSIRNDLFTIYR